MIFVSVEKKQPPPGLQKSWETRPSDSVFVSIKWGTRPRYDICEQSKDSPLLDYKRAGRQGQGMIFVSDARTALSWITKELGDKAKV